MVRPMASVIFLTADGRRFPRSGTRARRRKDGRIGLCATFVSSCLCGEGRGSKFMPTKHTKAHESRKTGRALRSLGGVGRGGFFDAKTQRTKPRSQSVQCSGFFTSRSLAIFASKKIRRVVYFTTKAQRHGGCTEKTGGSAFVRPLCLRAFVVNDRRDGIFNRGLR